MLEVSGISRCYGDFLAVDKVSFNTSSSEIVGLLGHNGAGKTTIMKMLSGYLEPHTGYICINGLNLATHEKRAQQLLGYLPENLPVYPELTVADYLDYAATLKGLQGTARRNEVCRVIENTDIKVKALEPIATLSRGYKQRVGVAQALLGRPQLLILDEPTNGLDPTQTEHMRELIRTMAREATIIISTHIMQEVEALCSRVLILNRGKLVVDEQLEQLRHSNHLLVSCSLDEVTAHEVFSQLPGVAHVESLGSPRSDRHRDTQRFRLSSKDSDGLPALSALLARTVLDAGGELFELCPATRDLESLFREVSQAAGSVITQEENRNAA